MSEATTIKVSVTPVRAVRVALLCQNCGVEMQHYDTQITHGVEPKGLYKHRCINCRTIHIADKIYPCIEFEDIPQGD